MSTTPFQAFSAPLLASFPPRLSLTDPNRERLFNCHVTPGATLCGNLSEGRCSNVRIDGGNVVVESAIACEITPHAQAAFRAFDAAYPYSSKAIIFTAGSSSDVTVDFIWAPSGGFPEGPPRPSRIEPEAAVSRKPRLPDKVEAREIAAKVGILLQPKFVDLRNIAVPAREHYVELRSIDFSPLPIDALFGENSPEEIVFEGVESGFLLRRAEGGVEVVTRAAVVNEVLSKSLGGDVANPVLSLAELRFFLKDLSESTYAVVHPSMKNANLYVRPYTVVFASLPDGGYYLKDARGVHGDSVFRLELRNGRLHDFFSLKDFPDGDPSSATERFAAAVAPDWQGIRDIHFPILEYEIPLTSCDGKRAEPRALIRFKNGKPSYLCAYSKVGTSIVANGTKGGTLEPYRESFARTLSHHSGLALEALPEAVDRVVVEYKRLVAAFATAYEAEARKRGFRYDTLFAVDARIFWNGSTAKIELYHIEVQAGPDITGAFENMDQSEREAAMEFDRDHEELVKYDY